MDVLDAGDELISKQQHSLQRKLAVAEVEQILQGGAKKVQNHGIVVALGTKPADEGDTHAAGKRLVDTGLILELRVLGLDALELDGNLFPGDDVGTQVDVTEGARANFAADAVFVTDTQVLSTQLLAYTLIHLHDDPP